MRDRLASLSDEARSIRAQVPHEFEPDVERIQQQMQRLGERLSVLSGGQGQRPLRREAGAGSQAASDEVILLGAPSKTDNPWDEQSANALTRFYESGEPFAACRAGPPDLPRRPQAQGAARQDAGDVSMEPAWLNERFADIAQRIEQSLAEIRPESSLLTLGRRFDQLEERMTSALRGVSRTDMGELRGAEAQIEEINTQLDQFRRQLARLDAIDAHLGTLAAQLSDERLGRLFNQGSAMGGGDASRLEAIDAQLGTLAAQLSHERLADLIGQGAMRSADLEGWADAAAQKVVTRLADQHLTDAQPRDIGEVRGMLESFINERRHSDENNASMLETMQQAIIRVLDRIDALELGQQHAGEPRSGARTCRRWRSRGPTPSTRRTDFQRPRRNEICTTGRRTWRPSARPSAWRPTSSRSCRTSRKSATRPRRSIWTQPLPASAMPDRSGSGRPSRRPAPMDVLRHDFIADAHRAKLKAASKLEGPQRSRPGAHGRRRLRQRRRGAPRRRARGARSLISGRRGF